MRLKFSQPSQKSDRPCLILLHGGPALPYYTERLAQELSLHYPVIDVCFRSRVHTQSPPPYDIETHRADLFSLVKKEIEEKEKKCILIGHSFGGLMAASFVSHYSQLPIESLFMICPAPIDTESRELFLKNVVAKWSKQNLSRRNEIIREIREPSAPQLRLWNEYWQLLAPTYFFEKDWSQKVDWADWDYEAFNDCLKSSAKEFQEQTFILPKQEFKKPVIVIGAQEDPCPIDSNFHWIKSKFSQAELFKLDRCGHFPWLENSETAKRFFSLLTNLLEQKNP